MNNTNHIPIVQYESTGKSINGQPFMTVKQARNYYEYASRAGIDSIFFILHDGNSDKPFGLINESKPPLDERLGTRAMLTTAFGGSMDAEATPQQITITEVLEEAGYVVTDEQTHFVGSTFVSSQMDQIAHGFIVDVTGIDKTHITESEQPEASEEFARNSIVWMTDDQLIANNDWKAIFIFCKLITNKE